MKAINDYINYQHPEEPDRCYFECLENRLFRKVTEEERKAIVNIYGATKETKVALSTLLQSYRADFKNITGSELNRTLAVKRAERALI